MQNCSGKVELLKSDSFMIADNLKDYRLSKFFAVMEPSSHFCGGCYFGLETSDACG